MQHLFPLFTVRVYPPAVVIHTVYVSDDPAPALLTAATWWVGEHIRDDVGLRAEP